MKNFSHRIENNSSKVQVEKNSTDPLIHDIKKNMSSSLIPSGQHLIASGGNGLSSVSFDGDIRLYATSNNDGRRKKMEDFMKYQQLVVLHLV